MSIGLWIPGSYCPDLPEKTDLRIFLIPILRGLTLWLFAYTYTYIHIRIRMI